MTQCELILRYLQEHGKITTYESYSKLFITRLPSRIYDLKQKGYKFEERWITKQNKYGRRCQFKEYRLVRKEED